MKARLSFILGFLFLALISQASAEDVTGCRPITRNGMYTLAMDVLVSDRVDCIVITAPKVMFTCNGHSLTGDPSYGSRAIVIDAHGGGSNIIVQNCTLRNWGRTAVTVRDSRNVLLDSLFLENNGQKGVLIDDSNRVTVRRSVIQNNYNEGIYIGSSSNILVENNYFENNAPHGIWTHEKTRSVRIVNNTFAAHNQGAAVSFEGSPTNNNITYNAVNGGAIGVWIEGNAHSNLVEHNSIRDTTMGIVLVDDGGRHIVRNNYVIATSPRSVGFILYDSKYNVISNNFFNVTQATLIRSSFEQLPPYNIWNVTATNSTNIRGGNRIGGNFWASPNGSGFSQTCADSNRDGFCDLPYKLAPNNIDFLALK